MSGGDKFDGVGWRKGTLGTPVLDGVLAWVECRLDTIHDAGDHELVTGSVVAMSARSGSPLLYYRAQFGTFEALP